MLLLCGGSEGWLGETGSESQVLLSQFGHADEGMNLAESLSTKSKLSSFPKQERQHLAKWLELMQDTVKEDKVTKIQLKGYNL